MKIKDNLYHVLLTAIFAVAIFLFWTFKYPQAIAFQEQFQLFRTTTDYFVESLSLPGGLACYVSEFLVQFYNIIPVGAVIISLLFTALQWACWKLIKRYFEESNTLYPLSFIPSIGLWIVVGDYNVMPAFVVSLLVVVMCFAFLSHNKPYTRILSIVAVPVIYWICGSVVAVFILCAVLSLVRKKCYMQAVVSLGLLSLILVACVIGSSFVAHYQLSCLFKGLFYYRYPDILKPSMVVVALLPALILLLPQVKCRRKLTLVSTVAVALLGVLFVPRGFDEKTYEMMDYDYLVRTHRWNDIIRKAEKNMPDLPMSVSATNLALGMEGELGDRGFEFYQNGMGGLLPPFEKLFTSQLVTAETYFLLGLTNTAQRLSFETMECLPNYKKSCRIVKRLAETNLINGQYGVARKYLLLLENTLFYKKWAQKTMALLGNEAAINRHPLYGKMRKFRLEEDFLFSDSEQDKILARLFVKDNDNRLALQYMMFAPLLQCDLGKFADYFSLVVNHVDYNPISSQQAMAMIYSQKNEMPPQGLISEPVLRQFSNFVRTMQSGGSNIVASGIGKDTFWNYFVTKH